jgi:hypothetical protein
MLGVGFRAQTPSAVVSDDVSWLSARSRTTAHTRQTLQRSGDLEALLRRSLLTLPSEPKFTEAGARSLRVLGKEWGVRALACGSGQVGRWRGRRSTLLGHHIPRCGCHPGLRGSVLSLIRFTHTKRTKTRHSPKRKWYAFAWPRPAERCPDRLIPVYVMQRVTHDGDIEASNDEE